VACGQRECALLMSLWRDLYQYNVSYWYGKCITVLYMGSVCIFMVLTFLDVGVGRYCSHFLLEYLIYHVVRYGVILNVCIR